MQRCHVPNKVQKYRVLAACCLQRQVTTRSTIVHMYKHHCAYIQLCYLKYSKHGTDMLKYLLALLCMHTIMLPNIQQAQHRYAKIPTSTIVHTHNYAT